jgi:hypothetical protein
VSKIPEWAMAEAERIGEETYGRHVRGFILWPIITEGGLHPKLNIALALVAAEKRGIERAAKIADEAAAMRARLFEENGASLNASKAVQAEELAAAIRQLGEPHEAAREGK